MHTTNKMHFIVYDVFYSLNLVNKIHHKQWSAFCRLFKYYGSYYICWT